MSVNRELMASKVMSEAIELTLEGRSPFPRQAVFIDADLPSTSSELERAVQKGVSAVLVSSDGSTQVVPPSSP
jgi:hypothetical protein